MASSKKEIGKRIKGLEARLDNLILVRRLSSGSPDPNYLIRDTMVVLREIAIQKQLEKEATW
jgi:hypothetical protein